MTEDIFETPSSTPNFQTQLAEQLAELAPEVVADGKIDVLKLQELLAQDAAATSERFGLTWPGKQRALRVAQMPTNATLRPQPEQSRDWGTTKNVFIEGDNLEVLKILQKHYHGKIDMIYIDPPYNTGKDFVYPDNYVEGIESYLEWSRQVNDDGKKISTNSETEGRYHSNWLNMMYPRLKLARNLLAQDGLVFVSIDDNELDNLIKICNEIFGESNYVSTLAVEMSKTQGMKVAAAQNGQIVKNHEYVLIYSRNSSHALLNRQPLFDASEVYDSHYDVVWASGETPKSLGDILQADSRSAQTFNRYGLKVGKSTLKQLMEIDKQYHDYFLDAIAPRLYRESPIALDSVQQLDLPADQIVEWNKYVLRKNSKGTIVQLQPFLDGVHQTDDYVASRARATIRGALWKGFHSDMMNVGKEGGVEFKNGKKPMRLIAQLIKWVNRPEGIVLDFFAGSGTTAEAVVRANDADGGSRRFVLVQLPEPIEAGKKVSDITQARLANIRSSNTLGQAKCDVGFRKYLLSDTNFTKWRVKSEVERTALEQHLFDLRDSSKEVTTGEELLSEVLLKLGYSLSESITKIDYADLAFFSVGEGLLVAYMNEEVKPSLEVLRQVIATNPLKFVMLEDSFQGDDELKTNLGQLCKSKNIELWTA